MDTIHEEKRNGLTIKIIPDDNPISPDESGDDSLFLTANHRQFCVKAPKDTRASSTTHFTFALEAYIHSGVRLALSGEGNFCDRSWDVSSVGDIFVSKEYWPTPAKARKAALSLIEEWNNYLSGNVYGYQITDAEGNDIDSCWGYYGDYNAKGGILDEARAIVDRMTNKGKTDEKGQYLMPFMAAA